MSIRKSTSLIAIAGSAVLSSGAFAATVDLPDVSVDGFIRADYGVGDRYPKARGEDRLGISKAALAISAQKDDIKGVFVVGTEVMTDGDPNNDGNVDIKDAFIVIGAGKEKGLSVSVGAQALLFGLKPNGYPGDRSLQPSIEYGGGGTFAVSNQAGPSLIGTYAFTKSESLRFGAFDLNRGNGRNPPSSGSKVTDNLFVLWRGGDLFGTGLYATAGVESLYVGGTVGSSRALGSVGVGFKQGMFDVSVEVVQLNKDITATTDTERYAIAEFTVQPVHDWTLYLDYSNANKLDVKTYRLGANYQWRKHLSFSAEASKDDFRTNNVSSVDIRATFDY